MFFLDPDVTFLNHGSFGATPRPVMEVYQNWQREMEREPVDFFCRRSQNLIVEAKAPLCEFLGCQPENLAFVTNATTGTNIVAWSLALKAGDEVLLNDHEYGAVYRNFLYLSERFGFTLKVVPLPVPLESPEQVVEALFEAVTEATRVIVMSHITSPSALLLPVEQVIARARERGILTLIDGAHAPGHIDLHLEKLGADFYVGNLHKWLSAPKGAAVLYVDPRHHDKIQPLLVGWAYHPPVKSVEAHWIALTQQVGTRDLSSFLSVPAALKFHQEYHNEPQRAVFRQQIQEWLNAVAPDLPAAGYRCPLQIGAVMLPLDWNEDKLHNWLWENQRIEVPVQRVGRRAYLRPSFNSYNRPEQLAQLSQALRQSGF